MNNREVCDCIRKVSKKDYLGDLCVKEGYGQSCGGYLSCYNKNKSEFVLPSEREHFLNYYNNEKVIDKKPTYHYLRCPQLILFIAEIAGVSNKRLYNAYELLKNYENQNRIRCTEKNGNYIWGKDVFRDFKMQLQFNKVNKIICDSKTWDEVIAEVKKI